MRAFLITAALVAASQAAVAQQQRAEHPSVAAHRIAGAQGYDYASKFYPHPAWLYLSAQAPRPLNDHPAVTLARRAQAERERAERQAAVALAQR